MKTLWKWICSFFTKENLGVIWRVLFNSAKTTALNIIHDAEVQRKAFDIAKSMLNSDISSEDKRQRFDSLMIEQLNKMGKEVGSSTLNTIRELAVEAVKTCSSEEYAGVKDAVMSSVLKD